ncbi:MAG: ABC transporter permease [Spirochaetales bacterium]|nr:ABC transporter permease [Spirochaetales bacterium]
MKDSRNCSTVQLSGVLVTLAAAAVVVIVSIFILSKTPFSTIYYFFIGPFANKYYLGNMLNSVVPLIFTGLGISFAFKASMFNLGGEGQVYAGGFIAASVALLIPSLPGVIGIFLSLLVAAVCGALIAGLSGFFKMKWNTDELITSFLISNALIYTIDFFITGPMDDPTNNLLATRKIASQYHLLRIFPPSSLNISVIIAILAVIFSFWILFKTNHGYELRLSGLNSEFARYGGINIGKYIFLPMLWSGAFNALAGAVSVLGTTHCCIKGFSNGVGWNGIAVALIARNNPAAVVPAALFFAFIEAGANSAMINADVTIEIASIVKAVIFFLITSRVIYNSFRRKALV